MSKTIAIIGAGPAGLAAALELAGSEAEVRIFEKSRGLTGRAASRSRNDCRYDHGANYFTAEDEEVARLLFEKLPTDDLCRVEGDVLPFDGDGTVGEGDPEKNARDKWTYRGGINTLGKLMAEASGVEITRETRIARLVHSQLEWKLESEDGETFGGFDGVLLTAPGPQTVELLRESDFDPAPRSGILSEMGKAQYHGQHSVVLNFAGEVSLPRDCYALVNADGEHDVAWLSLENRKPGHVPDGESVLVAQMAPHWTEAHGEASDSQISEEALAAVRNLVEGDLPEPAWTDVQRWRYAHPYSAASFEAMRRPSTIGLFFAGDAFVGKGRVADSIRTGIAVARDIAAFAA